MGPSRIIRGLFSLGVTLLSVSITDVDAARRPNLLIVLTDDQGFGDIASHGNRAIRTPHQDRLAADGARFDRFYVSPVCAPTRASLLTGRWHLRTGVHGVTRGFETMRSEEQTIAELFRAAGYATAAVGKWHNGAHFPEHPRGQGFDEFFGFCAGHFNNYFDSRLEHNGRLVDFQGFMIDRMTDQAIDFIERHRDRPWFCYVAYNTPHSPWQVPDKYWQRYADRVELPDDKARCAYAMVENLDDNLGRMVESLEARQLSRDTIIVFLTDNGANSDRYNAGMRGRKGSLHEGGTRVPCFVRWPERIAAGQVIGPIAAHVDLLPTLCELAGVSIPNQLKLDGVSLVPLLRSNANQRTWPPRMLFTHWRDDELDQPRADRGAVRTDRWRAVLENQNWQLYDMRSDPGERQDLARDHSDVVERFDRAFRDWFTDVTSAGYARIPIQVRGTDASLVTLPAHEAQLHPRAQQGIRYRGRAGWANDWITGWTDSRAFATWELSVVTGGAFDVIVHYGADAEQAQNVIQVTVGDASVKARLDQPHVADVVEDRDRIERIEVPERRWGQRTVGTLTLRPGRFQLVVRAIQQHSSEIMDLKAISLRRR